VKKLGQYFLSIFHLQFWFADMLSFADVKRSLSKLLPCHKKTKID